MALTPMYTTRFRNPVRFKDGVVYMHVECAYRGFVGEAKVDVGDMEKILAYGQRWRADWFGGGYRVVASRTFLGKKSVVLLHRFLLGPSDLLVDHINRDPLDNRRANLRTCTQSQNGQNRRGAQANSTSGVRGVYWRAEKRKWSARCKIRGCIKHLGYFATIEEADRAAKAGRAKYMTHSQECAQ